MKNLRITIFITPTRILYTKIHPKIMKIEDLHNILTKLTQAFGLGVYRIVVFTIRPDTGYPENGPNYPAG